MLLTQCPYSPIIPFLIAAFMTVNVCRELGTGETRMYMGNSVCRRDNPYRFWFTVSFEGMMVCLFLIGTFKCVRAH